VGSCWADVLENAACAPSSDPDERVLSLFSSSASCSNVRRILEGDEGGSKTDEAEAAVVVPDPKLLLFIPPDEDEPEPALE